jgi:GT2 family glycosyltransferase
LSQSPSTALDLTIIIVSYNARVDLERCLSSIAAAPPGTTYETIVVDNASTDGSAEAARAAGVPVNEVIEVGGNVGFARANNIGFRASRGVNVLLLNSDTVIPPGAPGMPGVIDRLLLKLSRHPEAAIVGPRLIDGEGRAELSFGRMIGPLNEWRQKRLVTGHARRDPRISAEVEAMTRREQSVDWVSGACMLVRRADAEAVGLFDERYFMYIEDVDFCAAIRARGRRILFTPSVEVVHLRGRSAATAPTATERAYARSRLAFYEKHHPAWAPLLRLLLRVRGADRG